jgi:hypothetical protein
VFFLVSVAAGNLCRAYGEGADTTDTVNHRYYSLDSWIGAIGLPDDPFKSVVDADGTFWTEIGLSSGRFGVYPLAPNQTPLKIRSYLEGATERVDQRMLGPRVPISITHKRQGGVAIEETLFLARPLDWSADVKGGALKGRDSRPLPRQYLLMTEYLNNGDKPVKITPLLDLQGSASGINLGDSSTFEVAPNTQCWTTLAINPLEAKSTKNVNLELKTLTLPPAGRARWVLSIDRNGFKNSQPVAWDEAQELRKRAIDYWEKSTALPYYVIETPDPEIQSILDASIRELYQMRYVINDLPAYFFGPRYYNDYWVLDGSFVTEALAMLGRLDDASGYADYMLLHQQPDGRIQCMSMYWKETGIALVTLYRHAQLLGDKEWLHRRWPQFRRAVEATEKLRGFGTSADPQALNYHLSPEGFGDGGVGFTAEFTNNYWLLAGMKAAVEAARWLGETKDAEAWEKEYVDFDQVFQQAIARDAKTDGQGNRYIPAVMGPAVPEHPTRGQWAFCQGVYPGRIFPKDDPLMLGTLKMLEAHEVEGGIVADSGWIGIWAQCGSFYGHDWLWLGEGQKAARLLYAFADHASPVWNFREETPHQIKQCEVFPYDRGSGDMPHVSAAAEFIRLVGHLLAFDRGAELHLFEGLPAEWLKPGMTTRLNGLVTPFGPLVLELKVAPEGNKATLKVAALRDPACQKIVVHLGGTTQDLAPGQSHEIVLNLHETH